MVYQLFKQYGRDCRGATAVEFSLIALPLVFLIFGLIEISMVFTKQGVLEYATLQAARQIRTGQAQQSGDPETIFRTALCDNASFLLDCDNIAYEVQTMDSFAEANEVPPPVFNEEGELESQGFIVGGAETVTMIRTIHRHPIITPMMQPLLSNGDSNSTRLLITTVVLETEPYEYE